MSGFVAIRHPDVKAVGSCPVAALEMWRARGWFRVSEPRAENSDLHLPDYADAVTDLDAPAPEPKPEQPAKATTKESKA